jgi:hypothetical protein
LEGPGSPAEHPCGPQGLRCLEVTSLLHGHPSKLTEPRTCSRNAGTLAPKISAHSNVASRRSTPDERQVSGVARRLGLGGREPRSGAGRQPLQVLAARAGLGRALAGASTMPRVIQPFRVDALSTHVSRPLPLPDRLRHERRYRSTASTRRDSPLVDGSPSLVKMVETYFSTARSVITSASAMP